MPTAAAAAGGADLVLAPEAIAVELARIARDPRFAGPGPRRTRLPRRGTTKSSFA